MQEEKRYHSGIDIDLKSRILPAPLVIRGFVPEDSRCDYEKYLTELINNSSCFKNLSEGESFKHNEKQSDGESDAVSSKYEIDFKLTESSSRLEALRLHSSNIKCIGGVTCYSAPTMSEDLLVTRLHCGLRALKSFAEIDAIMDDKPRNVKKDKRRVENIDEQVRSDIYDFFKTMKKKKNLLYYIPEEFFFEESSYSESEELEKIRKAMSIDFQLAFGYRKERIPDYNTFISCIYNKQLLFFLFEEGDLICVDKVPLSKSDTFEYLSFRYTSFYD